MAYAGIHRLRIMPHIVVWEFTFFLPRHLDDTPLPWHNKGMRGKRPSTKGLIIMTRTHIITGDGTHYEEVGATKARNRKILRRVIGLAATLATAIFLSAVIIGFSQAATPTALPKPLAGALTACKGVDARWQGYCIGLYLRPAHKDANTFTPAGPALVKECLDQYKGQELASCLTQPTD